ncbi:MAG: hypothetical protein SGBAC_013085 [Bacillariaceae sp.]
MEKSKSDDPQTDPSASASASPTTASASPVDDATIAQCWQAVESLTTIFGFPYEVANHAVNEVGPDVTACYNFILDQQLAKDGGGSIAPIDSCPHIAEHVKTTARDVANYFANSSHAMLEIPCCMPPNQKKPTGGLKSEAIVANKAEEKDDKEDHCPLGENWFCLATKKVLCSRYVNGHALQHWKDTGNCVAVSLADLSVWCHICEAYIKDKSGVEHGPILKPILKTLEDIKFGGGEEEEEGKGDATM